MTKISLSQIMDERQASVFKTPKGDAIFKITSRPTSWNSEKRTAKYVMNAETEDRYGDIVIAKGGDFTNFNNNPVALWSHRSGNFPIGRWDNVKAVGGTQKRVEGDLEVAKAGTSEDVDTAASLMEQDMLRACSIGFMPKEWEAIDKENPWGGYRFLEWELWECSPCSIPAHPSALMKTAGGDSRIYMQMIERALDEWALTPEGLIVPRKSYETAYLIEKKKNVTVHEVRAVEEKAVEPVVIPAVDMKAIEDNLLARILKALTGGANKEVVLALPPATPDVAAEQKQAAEAETARVAAEAKTAEEKRVAEAAEAEELEIARQQLELRARALAVAA